MDKPTEDPKAVIFYLYKTMEDINISVNKIEEDINAIHIDIAIMKQTGPQPSRLKANAAGGGMGAVIAAVLMGVWEFVKSRG